MNMNRRQLLEVSELVNIRLLQPELVAPRSTKVVRSRRIGVVTIRLVRVGCAKPDCRACPHGPYWYCRWNGRQLYVGKDAAQARLYARLINEAKGRITPAEARQRMEGLWNRNQDGSAIGRCQ